MNDFFPLRLKIKHAVLKFYLYTLYKIASVMMDTVLWAFFW